jgi:threonine dehydrogenase-like Zn-dependent dehydrogenase
MKALVFRYSFPRLAMSKIFGALSPRAYLSRGSSIYMEEISAPVLPAADWLLVRTGLTGICGSDAKQVFLVGNMDNPLTALITFPQVLGHEVVGTVEQAGTAVKSLQEGQRVVLNPWLSCLPRGIQPLCDACQRGEYYLCDHFTDGDLPPGMHIGNCSPITGGYAPFLVAHQSQWFPIPDGVSLEQAVLADPFSVSMHGVLKAPPVDGDRVVVYGCGTLGLLTIAILRKFYPGVTVIALARYPHQEQMARQLGAQHVLWAASPLEIIETVASLAGAKVHRPWHGKPMLMRGVKAIYDTVGSRETIEVGVRILGPHGKLVITGVANPARFEWTPLYFKEIEILGSNAFGLENFQGMQMHAMQIFLRLLDQKQLDLSPFVTHHFRLEQYQQALLTAHNKAKNAAIKVVFDFTDRKPGSGG